MKCVYDRVIKDHGGYSPRWHANWARDKNTAEKNNELNYDIKDLGGPTVCIGALDEGGSVLDSL